MPQHYEDAGLIAHIEATAPEAADNWPIAITAPGHAGYFVMSALRYRRLMETLPDPQRAVRVSEMSPEEVDEILAAIESQSAWQA